MKSVISLRFGGFVAVVGLLTFGAIALAQNQTNSTQSQSQSGTGSASSSASASARSGGSQSAIAGQSGGNLAGAGAGAGSVGAPLKGMTYLVHWTPNVGAQGPANALALHRDYVKSMGAKYGVLMEGVLGDSNGRLAIVQGSAQSANEFAMGSPLVQARMATIELTPYSLEFSRVGLIGEKATAVDDPAGGSSTTGGHSSTQSSGGSTQGSGNGG